MVPWPAPVAEPPITMLPGGDPGINASSVGMGTAGNAPSLICPRPNPPPKRQHALLQTRHWNRRPEGIAGRRQQTQSRIGVGHDRDAADSQPLPEPLIISKQKELISL